MESQIQVGSFLGPYQIVREIARGGQGAVFEGRNGETGVRVAIKVLSDLDPVQLGRFIQEAQVLSRLRHLNLPQVFEVVAQGQRPWFAMELIQGQDLKDWVTRGGLPEPSAIVEVLAPIARALHYCHGQGIVHRDLKPANILIETRTARPVLADFGLVQRDASQMNLEAVDALGRLSMTHEVKGTPSYMAPEQADTESLGGTGPHTDVYALGATLFYLLTGSPPQEGQSTVNVMVQLLKRSEAPDPRVKNPEADPSLSEICRVCLASDPSERFPSALALGEALEESAQEGPSGGGPRRLALAAASLLGLLAMGGAALALLRQTTASASPMPPGATLVLRVDADEVEVLRGQERLGWASAKEPLRLDLSPGPQVLTLRRAGASSELRLNLPAGETSEQRELWREVDLDPGLPARGSVFLVGGDAPVRDETGRSLQGVELPTKVRLPLGRYRVALSAEQRHPRQVEFVVAGETSAPDMSMQGEIRWRKKIEGTLWACRPGEDLDGDGTGDLLLHASAGGQPERIQAFSGVDGAELWERPVPINLWTGSYFQHEPRRAVVAVRGKGPTNLLWLDPATGRELQPPFSQGEGRPQTFYGIAGFDGGRRGLVVSSHFYDEKAPGRELIRLGPGGEERGRIDLAALGMKGQKHLRGSYPAPFDARGSGRAKAVLWRFHRTYFLVELDSPSRVIKRYDPPRASAAIRNYRNWWCVGDSILPVTPDGRSAILSWIGQESLKEVQSYLSLISAGSERRWTTKLPGFYTWGRWLELRSGPVFAACVLVRNTRARGRLVLIDPESGDILRQTEVSEGLIGTPSLLRSRGGLESIVIGTYKPALVRLLDAQTLEPRWSRDFRNETKRFRGKEDLSFEVGRYVVDLDRDGNDELALVRSWDGELLVVDPILDPK